MMTPPARSRRSVGIDLGEIGPNTGDPPQDVRIGEQLNLSM